MKQSEWLKRHKNDPYVKKSKKIGTISRAYFKLQEIDEKFRITNNMSLCLDLGACPGGWSQYLLSRKCKVHAIDINNNFKVEHELLTFDQCDIENFKQQDLFDVIVSDISTNLTGIQTADRYAMENVIDLILKITQDNLKTQGHLVFKLFSSQIPYVKNIFLKIFTKMKFYKPPASRKESKEIYCIGLGKK